MTLQDEIKLISEILVEKGLGESDEALLQEKIRLLEKIISDPAKYKEYDNLPTYLRYQNLKRVAMEINAADTKVIEEWKIPIERKIEECQEKLNDVAPEMLEEAMKKQKRDLYIGIIGRKAADTIQKGCNSLEQEVEELRKAAQKINPVVVDVIDEWDLSEDQKDYAFVQQILRKTLSGNYNITDEDKSRFDSIRERVANPQTKQNNLTREMKNLLSSSTVSIINEVYNRRKIQEAEKNANKVEKEEASKA